jgi:uncharacterized protein
MKAIGKVIGPGEEAGEIKIQTKDNSHSRVGEYLIYKIEANGEQREVFASITGRSIGRNLPATFLADPGIDATDVAAALGLDDALDGIEYELTANTLGYFDEILQSFINPRINPSPNTTVYLAPDGMLQPTLFSKNKNEVGSAQIGHLLLRPEIPAVINVNEMVSTHLAILAGTGSGKSYLARVLLEELLRPYNRAAIAVFDPHGEYQTLESIGRVDSFKQGKYQPSIKTLLPGIDFQITISELSFGDIRFLLPDITEKMSTFLETMLDRAKKKAARNKRKWAYYDLLQELEMMGEESEDENSSDRTTLRALRWRLERRFNPKGNKPKIFVDEGGTALTELFRPGQCTIVRLDGIDEDEQQVLAAIMLRKIYNSRMRYANQEPEDDPRNALEYPVFVLMEEAHRFAPAGEGHVVSTKILRTILSEGRKFGVGVGLITQRPGKLDQNVLSQCMTQFLMRIINPTDQDSIAKGVESAGRDLLRELPSLSKGQAIVAGVAVRTPVLFKVRKAISEHKGASANSAEEWLKYFDADQEARRGMTTATLGPKDSEKDLWEF